MSGAAPVPAARVPAPRVLWRLASYVGRHRRLVTGSVLAMFALMALDLVPTTLLRGAIDGPVANGSAEGLLGYGIAFLVVIVVGSFARSGQQVLTVLTGQRIGMSLRLDVFAHLQRMGLAYYDRHPVGMLVTRVTSDIEAVEEFFSSGVAAIFYDFLKLLAILGLMLWLQPALALTLLAVVPVLLAVTAVFTRRSRTAFQTVRAEVAVTNAYTQEAIGGIRVTRLFDRADRATSGFERHIARLYDAHVATVFNFAFFFPAVEFLQAVAVGAVLVVAAPRIVSHQVTYGEFLQFYWLINMFFEPLRDLSQNFNTLLQAMVSSERVFHLMDTPEQVPAKPGAASAATIVGRVTFEDVRFAYQDPGPFSPPPALPPSPGADRSANVVKTVLGPDVLRGISFDVPAGSTLALVGATGAGKSSVIQLVSRFYDVTGGRVLVDGKDVRDYDPRSLRSRIAVVLQDVFLFTGSVLENIRLGDASISRERVEAAGRAVHLDRLLSRLPKGLDEEVRERGQNFSLGERQLIAFARALAHDPAILVLDEATSSVDTETEMLVQDALATLRRGRTTIVVAHRLSTIKDADQILVMHHGEVRERGTHAELVRQDGLYRRLYEMQVRETGATRDVL